MNPPARLDRRRFLASAAATAAFGALPSLGRARSTEPSTKIGETDHFLYRLASEGPYVDSQRGRRAFGFGEGRLFSRTTMAGRGPEARRSPTRRTSPSVAS